MKPDLIALKIELKTLFGKNFQRIAKALVETQAKVRDMEETLTTKMATKDDVSRILGAIDSFAQKAENYDRKTFSHGDILQSHEASFLITGSVFPPSNRNPRLR